MSIDGLGRRGRADSSCLESTPFPQSLHSTSSIAGLRDIDGDHGPKPT